MGIEWNGGGYTGMAIGLANKVAGALKSQPAQSAQPGAQAKPLTAQPSSAAASRNKDSFEQSPGVFGQFMQYISGGAIR